MFPTKRRPHFGHLHMKTSLRVGRPSCLSLARRPGKMPRMTVDDRYELGRARFLEVHDDKALRAVEGLGDLGRSIVEFVYGDVYSREKVSTRERSPLSPPSWHSGARPSSPSIFGHPGRPASRPTSCGR